MRERQTMHLDRLLNDIDLYDRPAEARRLEITTVTEDSRSVIPGALYCCVPGSVTDGHDFAPAAVEAGAVALLVERELPLNVVQVRVSDVRAAVAPVAAAFYGHPARSLRMAGVTGTNGKTTTAHLLTAILRANRVKTETIGTLSGKYTSPPADRLQKMLAEIRDAGNQAVVMEVSSMALMQHRIDAVRFGVAIFTNLSQDHLDYHRSMANYFEAKSALFDPGRAERAIINRDDEYGRRLIDRLAVPLFDYGLDDAENLVMGPKGSEFDWAGQHVELALVGRFNVENALAAATAARSLGISPALIAQALTSVTGVPGRMESINRGQPFSVVVDFAHTPDGLENILNTARRASAQSGRVIVVFGCGGDRDATKRPQMGMIAEQLADVVIVANDNPRSEAPAEIAGAIVAGMHDPARVQVILDRRDAIAEAIKLGRPGDIVLIAGKGHEATQTFGNSVVEFDDRVVAGELLEEYVGGTVA